MPVRQPPISGPRPTLGSEGVFRRVPSSGDSQLDGQVRKMIELMLSINDVRRACTSNPTADNRAKLEHARDDLRSAIADVEVGAARSGVGDLYERYVENSLDAYDQVGNVLEILARRPLIDLGMSALDGVLPASQLGAVRQQLLAETTRIESKPSPSAGDTQDLGLIRAMLTQLEGIAPGLPDSRIDAASGTAEAKTTAPGASVGGRAPASRAGPLAHRIANGSTND
jgi:hypothetical protein